MDPTCEMRRGIHAQMNVPLLGAGRKYPLSGTSSLVHPIPSHHARRTKVRATMGQKLPKLQGDQRRPPAHMMTGWS